MEQADGGTLFLDEVGELPLRLQKSFLRALQEKSFRPLGGEKEVRSDFRLIAATNRDLEALVKHGKFRDDLLFRLRSFLIDLPPLRNRGEDLKLLTGRFVDKFCRSLSLASKALSPDLLELLSTYPWPGNVRELGNVLETTVTTAGAGSTLFPQHLPDYFRAHLARLQMTENHPGQGPTAAGVAAAPLPALPDWRSFRQSVIAEAERDYFQRLMSLAQGDVGLACRTTGLGRSQLYAKLRKYGLTKARGPEAQKNLSL
jgi:two-component system NtrC family response regulator